MCVYVHVCTTSSYGSVPACGRSGWTQERCQEMWWTRLHTGHVVSGELKINHLFQLSEDVAQGCYKGDGITFEPKEAPMEEMIKNWSYINDGRTLHYTSYRFTIWGPRSVLMERNIDFTEYHGLVLTDLLFDVLVWCVMYSWEKPWSCVWFTCDDTYYMATLTACSKISYQSIIIVEHVSQTSVTRNAAKMGIHTWGARTDRLSDM